MPKEIYEQRMKQLKQWLDSGQITGAELILLMSQAINELFTETMNSAMQEILKEEPVTLSNETRTSWIYIENVKFQCECGSYLFHTVKGEPIDRRYCNCCDRVYRTK